MKDYSELLTILHSAIGKDPKHDGVFRQASDAIEELLRLQGRPPIESPPHGEPSDHEAEGAMLYVMSRGKSAA
jgi:hypothetical protein